MLLAIKIPERLPGISQLFTEDGKNVVPSGPKPVICPVSQCPTYLVKFLLAEPLILPSEVLVVHPQVVLEVVPGAGDDGPPGHHPRGVVAVHWLVLGRLLWRSTDWLARRRTGLLSC